MAEWKLHTLLAGPQHGLGPDNAPWRAMFHRRDGERTEEIGLLYSELSAEVKRLEGEGQPVPAAFREAMRMMERAKEYRPLA